MSKTKLEKENEKLRKLLAEVEPALATASGQVEDLRAAVDTMTSTVAELEETLAKKDKTLDLLRKELDTALATVRQLTNERTDLRTDLYYETNRRKMAENKLHAAETQLHEVTISNLRQCDAALHMAHRGIRLDRNGEI